MRLGLTYFHFLDAYCIPSCQHNRRGRRATKKELHCMPLSRNTDHCFRAPDPAGALHHHRVNSRRARTSKTRSSPHILTQLLRTPASSCQHQMGWPMGRKDKENKQKRVVRERPKSTNPAHGLIYRPPARSRSWTPCCGGITLTITASRQWPLTAPKARTMIARAS